jgi:hypothetical protein
MAETHSKLMLDLQLETLYNGGTLELPNREAAKEIDNRLDLERLDSLDCKGIVYGGNSPVYVRLVFFDEN